MLLAVDAGNTNVVFAVHDGRAGFPVSAQIARTVAGVAELFQTAWPSSAELWLDGGRAPAAGGWWCNPALAGTYERIVAEAEAATGDRDDQIEHARGQWLRCWVAEAMVGYQASERGGVVKVVRDHSRVRLVGRAVTVTRGELVVKS